MLLSILKHCIAILQIIWMMRWNNVIFTQNKDVYSFENKHVTGNQTHIKSQNTKNEIHIVQKVYQVYSFSDNYYPFDQNK